MDEIDYVRFHAREDREARARAIMELRKLEAQRSREFRQTQETSRAMAEDIVALLRIAPEGAVKDEILERYGDAVKAKIAKHN